jgi:hypothetical protein
MMAGSAMRKSSGLRHTALAKSNGRSSIKSKPGLRYPRFALCIDNRGYEGSLWIGKVYRIIKPSRNDGPMDVRVIDEEGEDYLYSRDQFVPVDIPANARKVLVGTGLQK